MEKYSQNDEQPHILASLGYTVDTRLAAPELIAAGVTAGKFLDIGAFDGKTFSNTLALAELGWSGVCIEPCPIAFAALLKLHNANDKIKLYNVAVGAMGGLSMFSSSNGDAVSTLSAAHRNKWEGAVNFSRAFWTNTISIQNLLTAVGTDFDFINLDVEGTNMALFNCLPFEKFTKLRCICVEHDGAMIEIQNRLKPLGFMTKHWNGENIIMERNVA